MIFTTVNGTKFLHSQSVGPGAVYQTLPADFMYRQSSAAMRQ